MEAFSSFELFETVDAFILKSQDSCLWCNRLDGRLVVRSLSEFKNAWEPISLGIVYGCIGKIRLTSDGEWRLLLISKRTPIGQDVDGKQLYHINRVVAISMAPDDASELDLDVSDDVQLVNQKSRLKRLNNPRQKAFLQTLSTYRAAQTLKPKKEQKELEKAEKRMLEELLKMFSGDSFFYSLSADLTSSVQRMADPSYDKSLPIWKRGDDRFFWNKHMLSDLIKSEDVPGLDSWIVPVIQGHVEMHECQIADDTSPLIARPSADVPSARQNARAALGRLTLKSMKRASSEETLAQSTGDSNRVPTVAAPAAEEDLSFKLYVISRRSRHRTGTRFLRRGVDETGAVANFVETEQIVVVRTHVVSYVQVRGSIPVYWSQLSLKYRPPPKLDRSDEESQQACKLHFEDLVERHKKVVVINLVELQGREKIMADAYVRQMDMLRCPETVYITFDFHEHCKGMHFENVENLVDAMDPIIRLQRYCWRDSEGVLCQQQGVLRINCMDCLDRTNVVMAAMGRRVLLTVLFKLGLISPDSILPSETRSIFQRMWANNGDAISRQYAGTAALKGDFTRTGERSMMGVMKDGYNSASRYYVNHFRDVYRQAVMDLIMGNSVSEDLLRMARSDAIDLAGPQVEVEEEWTMEREESVAYSITKSQQLLVSSGCNAEGWAVVEHGACSGLMDTNDDIDLVVLLVEDLLYFAMYDYDLDGVVQYERVPLRELHSIQLGVLPGAPKSSSSSVFLRLLRPSGYYYTFRPVHSRSSAEGKECLLGIVQCIQEARTRHALLALPYHETKLSKGRSKRPTGLTLMSQSQMRHTWTWKPQRSDGVGSGSGNAGTSTGKRGMPGLLMPVMTLRRRPAGGGQEGSDDGEDGSEELPNGSSPKIRLKAGGRRMVLQMKRFMRSGNSTEELDQIDSASAPDSQKTSPLPRRAHKEPDVSEVLVAGDDSADTDAVASAADASASSPTSPSPRSQSPYDGEAQAESGSCSPTSPGSGSPEAEVEIAPAAAAAVGKAWNRSNRSRSSLVGKPERKSVHNVLSRLQQP